MRLAPTFNNTEMEQMEFIQQLMAKIDRIPAGSKKAIAEHLKSYLLDKVQKGKLVKGIIFFDDAEDRAEFKGMVDELGLDFSDVLTEVYE